MFFAGSPAALYCCMYGFYGICVHPTEAPATDFIQLVRKFKPFSCSNTSYWNSCQSKVKKPSLRAPEKKLPSTLMLGVDSSEQSSQHPTRSEGLFDVLQERKEPALRMAKDLWQEAGWTPGNVDSCRRPKLRRSHFVPMLIYLAILFDLRKLYYNYLSRERNYGWFDLWFGFSRHRHGPILWCWVVPWSCVPNWIVQLDGNGDSRFGSKAKMQVAFPALKGNRG